ncbi:MAG TPA: S8/S53 family peptidase [Legionellaceae bacterium]|nr:S8/S53 family peptidase [Legionellaceae bacterium]HVV56407.1 S8/S53 family peptidase [Mucilaginibacter sp.]
MKEYIVTKNILNIRSSASDESDDNFIGQLTAGETLYLTDDEIIGVTPKGGTTNIWKTDNLNRLVSLDGVRLKNYNDKKAEFVADTSLAYLHNNSQNEAQWKVSWGFVDLEVWKIWKMYNTQGSGVKVAVVDTGVMSASNDLKNRISNKSVSVVGNTIDDMSPTNHGTMSAGVIGANGATTSTVFGIAPQCELIIVKAGNNGFYPTDILSGATKAKELGANIISMSIECYNPIPGMDTFLEGCKNSGVIFLAAVGDMSATIDSNPASYDGCFSVGAYNLDANKNRIINPQNNTSKFLKCLCPGDHTLTCSKSPQPAFHNASSSSTAFMAGIMALVFAVAKKNVIAFQILLNALQSNSCTESIPGNNISQSVQGYGVLTPLQLITYLNSNT